MSQCILPYILHMYNTHVLKADPPSGTAWGRLSRWELKGSLQVTGGVPSQEAVRPWVLFLPFTS